MREKTRKNFCAAGCWMLAFIAWTALVRYVDVQAIGPNGSAVGLASVNGPFHRLTGVHMQLYTVTDWLGLVPLLVALGFALLGLMQAIKRRGLLRADPDLWMLGGFYIAVLAAYVLFEKNVINYRPALIDGVLEASYPSSTTLLTLCVMPTAMMQLHQRIKNRTVRLAVLSAALAFTVFMVMGRTISGVHWLTDIIGGVLLSGGLITMYYSAQNIGKPGR